jgi:hypothetical protein
MLLGSTSVKAVHKTLMKLRPEQRLQYVAAIRSVGPNAIAVRALRPGVPILGPAQRVVILVKQGILLFNAKPRN